MGEEERWQPSSPHWGISAGWPWSGCQTSKQDKSFLHIHQAVRWVRPTGQLITSPFPTPPRLHLSLFLGSSWRRLSFLASSPPVSPYSLQPPTPHQRLLSQGSEVTITRRGLDSVRGPR